ncbi:MAG: M20/M25/M40 family metallo-hydrolase [Candidatus Marinimicrobia bacterium]|nr:M20/M25/M40 family metallo-hydrolase [Candidatus Neomarinimicrobiota bacterium]
MHMSDITQFTHLFWQDQIIPQLIDYIKIPNKSPAFDPNWKQNGHMDKVLNLALDWVKIHAEDDWKIHSFQSGERTPLIMIEIPGNVSGNILMYGHLDKQPEMAGWNEGLGPWIPVLDGDKLYGRGGADDGYAIFASVCTMKALKRFNISHPRIVILIEFCEESGSPDLPFYVNQQKQLIGSPDLVICLDSGTGNYDQFWLTTSLRGLIGCTLRVDILKEGIHSGGGSGIVPSSFRIARKILSRLEDENTGVIKPNEFSVSIPNERILQANETISTLGDDFIGAFPWIENSYPVLNDSVELLLNNTWRPMVSITGAEGLPALKDSGNVLRPYTALKLSLRLPPTLDAEKAKSELQNILLTDPPYGAKVSLEFEEPATGWNAPPLRPWLEKAVQNASQSVYGKKTLYMGEGGTIPFMGMLGDAFPEAQFVITGVLGPQSNAHGPNEFLHIPYAEKLTESVISIVSDFPK